MDKFIKLNSLYVIILFVLILLNPQVINAACTPVSAELCAAVDDEADIYINGVYVESFEYCDIGWACEVECVFLDAAALALLQPEDNLIAVRLENTDAYEMWASWSMDITCDNGDHAFVSNGDGSDVSKYYDDSACPVSDPNPVGSYEWYDPLFDESLSDVTWDAPLIETGYKYGKRLFDPYTNDLLPALSYTTDSETGVDDCKQIFFRQSFDLTPDPTPLPPDFTITKSASRTTDISGPGIITFTLHVCNTGGGTAGQIVEVIDDWTSGEWRMDGPYGPWDDETFGRVSRAGATREETYTFENGFPSNSCYDIWFTLKADNPTTECITWYNNSQVNYPVGMPQAYSTVELSNFCPSPTPTAGPPDLSISKSASITTGITGNQVITFTIRICNDGDYIPADQDLVIFDDWSSSGTTWSYQGPYPPKGPFNDNVAYSASGETVTFTFENGFPGGGYCHNLWFRVQSWSSEVNCHTWHNDAFLSYQESPTLVATVPLVNVCITNTFTPTRTNTPEATPTLTPMPTMDVTKSVNVTTATIGDTITFTLAYHNTGSIAANDVQLWDTIPAAMSYIDCTGGCTVSGGLIIWNLGNIAPGGSGSVTWWGTIDSYPLNPLFRLKVLYAYMNGRVSPEYYIYRDRRFFIDEKYKW